ncbi:MAG TPA: hypothetical protein VG708_13925, partial [Mycobacteriales bacterium]|nr:hypothetical protein [Mycobacteriales bacterium]
VERLQLPSPGFYSQFDQTTRRDFINFGSGRVAVLQAPARPRITLERPRAGHSYVEGTRASARFVCHAGANNPLTSCRGTVPRDHRIHHSRIGRHTFVVRANPSYGKTIRKVVHYRIVRPGA